MSHSELCLPQFTKPETWRQQYGDVSTIIANAPIYLVKLVESGKLQAAGIRSSEDLSTVRIIALSGMMGASYFIEAGEKSIVVKFSIESTNQAAALNLWHEHGIKVPKVYDFGIVEDGHFNYSIMEGVKQGERIAQNAHTYLQTHPEAAADIGAIAGKELAKIHSIPTQNPIEDTEGNHTGVYFSSWNEFLTTSLLGGDLEPILTLLPEGRILELVDRFKQIEFTASKVVLHGDFSKFNILVSRDDPVDIRIIDPKAVVGDPYWDLARQVLVMQRAQKRANYTASPKDQAEYEKEEIYTISYLEAYLHEMGITTFDMNSLLSSLVIQTIAKIRLFWSEGPISTRYSEETSQLYKREMAILGEILKQQVDLLLASSTTNRQTDPRSATNLQ